MPQRGGYRRRKLCRRLACEEFRKFLAAARRALNAIDFPETADGRAARKWAVRAIMDLRNDLPIERHAVRDETGRFADGVRPRRLRGRCAKCGRTINIDRGCIGCPKKGGK